MLQVKNKFACKNEHLKRYRYAIWDTMEWFDALDIIAISRQENGLADKLAISTSSLEPCDELLDGKGQMDVNFKPLVPDNLDHWQVFRYDKHVLSFIHNMQEFSGFKVSYKEEGK